VIGPKSLSETEFHTVQSAPWQWLRAQMPVTEQWAYFDHAAVSPLSSPAVEAIETFAAEASQQGDTVWSQWASRCEELRQKFAELLNCDQGEICLVPNTTTGINVVAEGFPWESGDNIVLPDGEFPSNLFPWQNQESRGVEVRIVPRRDGAITVDDLMEHVDESTRIIAVSWVGYASGFRIDIDQLVRQAHQRGVLVFLDAIQGLGMYPLDLSSTPVDFLAADGHKWLLGPEGAGVAMIRREHLERLRCCYVGWGSVKNSHNYASPKFDLRKTAARFEPGSANMIGNAALAASVEMFCEIRRFHGPTAMGRRVVQLAEQLDQALQQLGVATRLPNDPQHRSGILTFDVPGMTPAEVRRRALEQKVVLSCRDGGVRASIHAYNNDDDLNRLTRVIADFLND
jgi:selenocysteine lyase/cysteine desulfurase